MRLEEDNKGSKKFLVAFIAILAVAVVAMGAAVVTLLPKAREAEEITETKDKDESTQWSDEDKRVADPWQSNGDEYFDPYGCAAVNDLILPDGMSKYLMQESIAMWAREGHVAPLKDVKLQQSFAPNADNPQAANEYGWSFVGVSEDSGRTVAFTVIYNPINQNFETYSQH